MAITAPRPDAAQRGTVAYQQARTRWAKEVSEKTSLTAGNEVVLPDRNQPKPPTLASKPPTTNATAGQLPKPPTLAARPPQGNSRKLTKPTENPPVFRTPPATA